jgi:uncharacterized protein
MNPFQLFTRHLSRRLSIVIALSFIFATAPTALSRQSSAPHLRNSCLWSIRTPRNTVYLLGSLHLLDRDAYPLAPAIENAYGDSERIIFETDIGAMNDSRIQTRMLQLGLYPQGGTLYQDLDGSTRQLLEEKLSELGLPPERFASFKPWFIALTLTVLELQRLGFAANYGVDVYFFNRAREDKKLTGFLEPPEYQLDLLGNMDMHSQKLFLRQTLADLELITDAAGNLVRYWETGDVDNLHTLLFKSFADYPAIHDRLLLQRNKKWVVTVEQLMQQSSDVLFIVGVGHLVGPGSVVDLLQKKGYTVKQR